MNIGRLKEPIAIGKSAKMKNELGELETVQEIRIRTRAEVRHDAGKRIEENGEIIHAYDITFIVWDYIGYLIEDRDEVIYKGRRYHIEYPQPVKEAKALYLKCSIINE